MRHDVMPSPGVIKGSQRLRLEACQAISFVEVAVARSGRDSEQLKTLTEFFKFCYEHCESLAQPITEDKPTKTRKKD